MSRENYDELVRKYGKEKVQKTDSMMRYDMDFSFRFPQDLQKRAEDNNACFMRALESD